MRRHVTQDAFTGVLAGSCRSTTTYAFIAGGSYVWVTLTGLGLGLLHKPTHSLILSLPIRTRNLILWVTLSPEEMFILILSFLLFHVIYNDSQDILVLSST
jgi:uncharacterized membrane protein YedE/YeeE